MTKMRTGAAISWLVGGVVWFVLLMLLAFLVPGAKITPKKTAKQFFTATQYQILYGHPEFDAQNPNPKFALNPNQVSVSPLMGRLIRVARPPVFARMLLPLKLSLITTGQCNLGTRGQHSLLA